MVLYSSSVHSNAGDRNYDDDATSGCSSDARTISKTDGAYTCSDFAYGAAQPAHYVEINESATCAAAGFTKITDTAVCADAEVQLGYTPRNSHYYSGYTPSGCVKRMNENHNTYDLGIEESAFPASTDCTTRPSPS